ncbi:hypothetical protein BSKO_13036 [Bryopsis sp. KO-2023]|nr:hypothetical protein BSKO_13036 [Bryopsis sp. KO-2023]
MSRRKIAATKLPSGWAVKIALLWLTVALAVENVAEMDELDGGPRRSALGAETIFSEEILESEFGVPEGSELLVQSAINCTRPPPVSIRPKYALICNWAVSSRECMGVGPTELMFVGRGCRGQSCEMDMVAGPARCILENYGVVVNSTDPALEETCGLSKQDQEWLKPTFNPVAHGADSECLSGEPPEVSSQMWAECKNGQFGKFKFRLNFHKPYWKMPTEAPYTCKHNPTCVEELLNKIVCHTEATTERNQTATTGRNQTATSEAWLQKKLPSDSNLVNGGKPVGGNSVGEKSSAGKSQNIVRGLNILMFGLFFFLSVSV